MTTAAPPRPELGGRPPALDDSEKVYVGRRRPQGLVVTVQKGGTEHPLEHFVRHSPTGFECGYAGSGPSDLARCILIDHLVCFSAARRNNLDDGRLQRVERLYQQFKADVVEGLDRSGFELPESDVREWVKSQP